MTDGLSPGQIPDSSANADFDGVIASQLNVANHVSRDWLAAEIRTRLYRPACRYVLLVGEPGSGKTGLMARLASEEPTWPRYFVRADSLTPLGSGDASSVLLALGHQLARQRPDLFDPGRLEIVVEQRIGRLGAAGMATGLQIGDLKASPFYRTSIRVRQEAEQADGLLRAVQIDRATLEPRLLHPDALAAMALLDPMAVLYAANPAELIVVLIDALDELAAEGRDTILDWLETGPTLPENLRFVLSSRPSARLKTLIAIREDELEYVELDTASTDVSDDVRAFGRGLFSELGLDIDIDRTVRGLTEAAEGNFAYLTAYGRALHAGLVNEDQTAVSELLAFESAPIGLEGLYATFVRQIRRRVARLGRLEVADPRPGEDDFVDPWDGGGQRLLGILAVAKAPLTLDQLAKLGGLRVWRSALNSLIQLFAPFLNETPQGLRLFHASFGEILTDLDREALSDIALDRQEWSQRIVRHYKEGQKWTEIDWFEVDDYGLLYLASHILASGGGAEALQELITCNLREACLTRFKTELPFRDLVSRAQGAFVQIDDPAVSFSGSLFTSLTLDGISDQAASFDPAVYGLMAKLGRVEEALLRLELTPPTLHKFRSLEAIVVSTPSADRRHLDRQDGVELLVDCALAIPETETPMIGHLGWDRGACLRSAAAAVAPLDVERALSLVEQNKVSIDPQRDRDEVFAAAAQNMVGERLDAILQRMGTGRLEATIDAARRSDSLFQRARLVEEALNLITNMEVSEEIRHLADLLALISQDTGYPHATAIEARLRAAIDQSRTDTASSIQYVVVMAASLLAGVRPDLARKLAADFTVGGNDADLALSSARTLALLGEFEASRTSLECALQIYRDRGWFGPAGNIADASTIARLFDDLWAESLADEAVAMLEGARKLNDDRDGPLEFALSAAVRAFADTDRPRALILSRMMRQGWINGEAWDGWSGRGNCLALIALTDAETDPLAASASLTEILSSGPRQRLGRESVELVHAGMFQDVSEAAPERRIDFSYVQNSNNYWAAGRSYRFLETPREVLNSLERSYPTTASWASALAGTMDKIAENNVDLAIALTDRLLDPGERLLALAGLAAVLHRRDDPRLSEVVGWLEAVLGAQRIFSPGEGLEQFPNSEALIYLDPTARMRIEAAIKLPEALSDVAFSLARLCRSHYLATCWQADGYRRQLLNAIGHYRAPPSLGDIPERFGMVDAAWGDMIRVAWAQLAARSDLSQARSIMMEVADPVLKVLVELYVVQAEASTSDLRDRLYEAVEGAPDAVNVLHRIALLRRACELARDQNIDVGPLVHYGISGLQGVMPLVDVAGAVHLAWVTDADQRHDLLTQALGGLDRIGVVYHRNEILADLAACAASIPDGPLMAHVAQRLVSAHWMTLAESLGRALPAMIDTMGVSIVERLDRAITQAQRVIAGARMPVEAPDHIDGVASSGVAGWRDDPRTPYLQTYLRQADVGSNLNRVQETRFSEPDEGDDAFPRLGGLYSGMVAWEAISEAAIGRLVDIRFFFPTDEAADAYHRERLAYNSEGIPPARGAPFVGEDCAVFGGSHSAMPGLPKLTAFHYVFRVGRAVAKVFAMQSVDVPTALTAEDVAVLAGAAERRIRAAL